VGEILRPFFQVHGSGRHVIIIVDMVGFCEVEKMGKDYKVKEIDLSGVKFIPGKYYYIDSFSKKLTEFDIYEFRIKADRVFAVGYNNQGTTEIEYDIPRELYTPLFAIARIAGWSAHRLAVTRCTLRKIRQLMEEIK